MPVPLVPVATGMSDLGDAIGAVADGVYTVTRYPPTSRVNGKVIATDFSKVQTFPVAGSMQPISGRELNRLPEGLRDQELREFFCAFKLRTVVATDGGSPADTVTDGAGQVWEVAKVRDWSAQGGFTRAVLAKRP